MQQIRQAIRGTSFASAEGDIQSAAGDDAVGPGRRLSRLFVGHELHQGIEDDLG